MANLDNHNISRYLKDSENGLPSLFASPPRTNFASISSFPRQYADRTPNASTQSIISQESMSTISPYSEYDESVFSGQSYKSATTEFTWQFAQPNVVAGWDPQIPQAPPMNNTIVLPCEFVSINCGVTFRLDDFENWHAHTLSHFNNLPPPSKCICLFCDKVVFEDHYDPYNNWRERMAHSAEHFMKGETNIRPDFLVLDYMSRHGLMSDADYTLAKQYTERPSVSGLVRKDFETPEEKSRRERESKAPHNLQKEERDRKRSSRAYKGQERQPSSSSRKFRPVSIKHSEHT